ncbi:MAG: recombinase family protein [Polyangiales bacterium]
MTNAILYVRTSTTVSSETQRQAIMAFCRECGFHVLGAFEDHGVSADGLQVALEAAKATPEAVVVVHEYTRLGRDVKTVAKILNAVTVAAVTDEPGLLERRSGTLEANIDSEARPDADRHQPSGGVDVTMSTTYKLRAETFVDVVSLAHALMPHGRPEVRCTDFRILVSGLGSMPDLEMELTSPLSIDELLDVIDGIEDGHVMYQTVQPIDAYTGERDYDRHERVLAERSRGAATLRPPTTESHHGGPPERGASRVHGHS